MARLFALACTLALSACSGDSMTPTIMPGTTPTVAGRVETLTPDPSAARVSAVIAPRTPARTAMPLTAGLTFPATVAAAEAEGAIHARAAMPVQPSAFFAQASGTAERRCVEVAVNAGAGIRSGAFVAGNFAHYMEHGKQTRRMKPLWEPLHMATMPGPIVRGVLLDDPGVTGIMTQEIVAFNAAGSF